MNDARASLTVCALAWNEARHLERCFKSLEPLIRLTGADTLVVFDPQGDQQTLQVARRVAARVVVNPFESFSVQRNLALDLAATHWLFFIDPDERCTPPLAAEIGREIQKTDHAAYRVPRRNILFGREVRHTGWWPDYQARLFDTRKCRFDERRKVHELPVVEGDIGTFSAPLIHYNYRTWRQFIGKQLAYAKLDAEALYESGRRAGWKSLAGQPLHELKRRLIDYEGYRDGLLGLALSLAMAAYTAETYRRLIGLQRRDGR